MRSALALALLLVCASVLPARAQRYLGSGSTFVFPVMQAWIKEYHAVSAADIVYEAIGSGGGLREMRLGLVDFAISDAPLTADQLAKDGLAQFPLVVGGIVPVVNLEGIQPGQLRFTGALLAQIYLGRIVKWSDPAIAALNPGVTLPARAITVLYRTDASGTTFNWADFLAKTSPEWKKKVGVGTELEWPVGAGRNGNGGVADAVAMVKGAIGFVEFSYVTKKHLIYGLVQNRSGNFVQPGSASFQIAAQAGDWAHAQDFDVVLTDAADPQAYPITATSFVLMRRQSKDAAQRGGMLAFFKWALEHGRHTADSLDYVHLPDTLVQQIEVYWQRQILAGADQVAKAAQP